MVPNPRLYRRSTVVNTHIQVFLSHWICSPLVWILWWAIVIVTFIGSKPENCETKNKKKEYKKIWGNFCRLFSTWQLDCHPNLSKLFQKLALCWLQLFTTSIRPYDLLSPLDVHCAEIQCLILFLNSFLKTISMRSISGNLYILSILLFHYNCSTAEKKMHIWLFSLKVNKIAFVYATLMFLLLLPGKKCSYLLQREDITCSNVSTETHWKNHELSI